MKKDWFKRKGLFFVPASLPAWLLFAAMIGMLVYTFVEIDKRSHSVSDTLSNFFMNMLMIVAAYSIIAYFVSGGDDTDRKLS